MDLAPDIEQLVLPKLRKQDASQNLHAMGDENWKNMYSVRAKKSAIPRNDTLDSFFNLYETPSSPSPQAPDSGIELARADTFSLQSSRLGADLKLADTLSVYSSNNESVIQLSRQPLNQAPNGTRDFDNPPERSPPCPLIGKKYSFHNVSLPQIPDMVRQTRQLVNQPRQLSAIDIRQSSFSPDTPLPDKKPNTTTPSHPSAETIRDGATIAQKSKSLHRSFFSMLSHLFGDRSSTPSRLFAETITVASSQISAASGSSSSSRGRSPLTWFSNWFSAAPHESSQHNNEDVDLEMNQHVQVVDEVEYDRRHYHKIDGKKTGRGKARGCLVFCRAFWGRGKS